MFLESLMIFEPKGFLRSFRSEDTLSKYFHKYVPLRSKALPLRNNNFGAEVYIIQVQGLLLLNSFLFALKIIFLKNSQSIFLNEHHSIKLSKNRVSLGANQTIIRARGQALTICDMIFFRQILVNIIFILHLFVLTLFNCCAIMFILF